MSRFRVGEKWNRRDGTVVTVNRVQPASVRVEYGSINYAVDLNGRYSDRPTDYDLIDMAQASPVCRGCDGRGKYPTAEWVDPVSGPECEWTRCEECNDTGKSLVLYVAGPMSGIPGLNFPAFHAKAAELRAAGYVVINPAEINGGADELVACANMTPEELQAHWQKCMRKDITALCTCDGIAMLDGWARSKGATLEHHVAKTLGLLVIEA